MDEEDILDLSIILSILLSCVACIINSDLRNNQLCCYKPRNPEYIEV